jgi:hypothetical protein
MTATTNSTIEAMTIANLCWLKNPGAAGGGGGIPDTPSGARAAPPAARAFWHSGGAKSGSVIRGMTECQASVAAISGAMGQD